jgi:sugar/nucleoside kinase (ribokinase family)
VRPMWPSISSPLIVALGREVELVGAVRNDQDAGDLKRILTETGVSTALLARISHRDKRIGAPNQRKLFCENDFLMIRGEPRCRQSVSRIFLDLKPSKGAR